MFLSRRVGCDLKDIPSDVTVVDATGKLVIPGSLILYQPNIYLSLSIQVVLILIHTCSYHSMVQLQPMTSIMEQELH